MADDMRDVGGRHPDRVKLSAQDVEDDIEFALPASGDYLILDGRGGGTGAAPDVFKDIISAPTNASPRPATPPGRARPVGRDAHPTGGLWTDSDFIKAMVLGADGVAVANSAMQAIGCLGKRACDPNNCPVGIATQQEDLRNRM
jgi:glutamate synthase domain-containing protein 2